VQDWNDSLSAAERRIVIGIDVGSTTVKTVVIDADSRKILWSRYERHETYQARKVTEQLTSIAEEFPEPLLSSARVFMTGSGAGPLAGPLGAKFVQEVNAVTMAVEELHPNVGSVIELGGQDAKIIIYKENPNTGDKRAIASMNDKCASGTGATIDKCVAKVGLEQPALPRIPWDASKLHHVAAKCGVFAETDIVNLVKSGIPATEVLCSLADAIVMQNLSVLTRGNTLRHNVLLLGGPNTYLPFLQGAWRQRIVELWRERGYDYPKNIPLSDIVFVPKNSDLYAAFGAAIYGLNEPSHVGQYQGLAALKDFVDNGRRESLATKAGPPLVEHETERDDFTRRYRVPPFTPAKFKPGSTVRAYIGVDGGSTSSKAVMIDEQGEVLGKQYQLSKGNPIADTIDLLTNLTAFVEDQGARLEVLGFGATGYAADLLEETLSSDVNVVETVAHMLASVHLFGKVDVICDVGGQDIKVLFMVNGQIRNFRLSNQCSAGNGMLLQAMAQQFGVPVTQYADTAFAARISPKFSYGCAVFLDADRVNFQKEGFSREEIMAGLALVLPKNIWQYIVQIPRLAELGTKYVLQGGTQYNLAAVKAQVDYIRERVPNAEIHVHPHCGEAGALGAALEAKRIVERRGSSSFIGIKAATALTYTTKNDEGTVCHFCTNNCKRTFIDTKTPSGRTTRYIAGFSCENGTVESKEELKKIAQHRKQLRTKYPNLVDYEAELAFRSFYKSDLPPEAGTIIKDVDIRKAFFGGVVKTNIERGFERSSAESHARRQTLRVGMPRVLNIYSTGPLWRTYFETVGLRPENVVFSDQTSEEMWLEGGKYGSVDPCYPAKVTQAHIHNLLVHKTKKAPLDYIFFPSMTHIPSFAKHMKDSASCTIVAGTPAVIQAAFTKEIDFFQRAGAEYVNAPFTLLEPNYFKKRMFETWGERLGVTQDESDFAVDTGFEALRRFDTEIQRRGLDLLEYLERENKVGLLLLGRPYHNDPGLNHAVIEEFQTLGYPVLSIRSIPKDEGWLHRFFKADIERKLIASPLDIRDVWPECYSTNSVEKVWAAKFAARHPNLGVLDLSSFKCGHDAPTYGLIDKIISATDTPYLALHDIDANKPGGSIKIRVKTYGYTLKLHEEMLQDRARKRSQLERAVEKKRWELLARRAADMARAREAEPEAQQEFADMQAVFAEYLSRDPANRDYAR
jgi:activator of 2-hydroxyglutaryl-CoA dehydratase/predicted nucleotide-binding protein (sugar kinase/HSP70/actin superfamily)